MIQKKPNQLKKCQYPGCKNMVTQYWKTLTINGVRTKCCQNCVQKEEKKRLKLKKEEKKIKLRQKREHITEKKLDQIQSKVIRTLYGNECCTCNRILDYEKLHNGHFISRQFRSVRFNPQNCASQCPTCNLYLQGLQYEFGKFINKTHGEGTAEKIVALSKSNIKIGQLERNLLYKIYEDALEHRDLQKLIINYYNIIK